MSDLQSKVQRRLKAEPVRQVTEVLNAHRSGTHRTTLYLRVDDVKALKLLAIEEQTSMTDLVNEGIALVLRSRQG